MKNLCIALMSAVLFGCGMSNESKDGIVGTWEVNANGIIYQITLSPDSTLTETLFGTLGRWQWKAGDSTTSEPAHLTLLNGGGTERWFFVNKVSETSLDLVAADNPISLK